MDKQVKKNTLFALLATVGLTLGSAVVVGPGNAQAAVDSTDDVPVYSVDAPDFQRVHTDANWRSEYHYAPMF